MAALTGFTQGNSISRIERRKQTITLLVAVTYHVVFDVPLATLVPGLFRDIDTAVIERAAALLAALEQAPRTPYTKRRLTTIALLRQRAEERVQRSHDEAQGGPTQASLFD